jgi:hypothetical protein
MKVAPCHLARSADAMQVLDRVPRCGQSPHTPAAAATPTRRICRSARRAACQDEDVGFLFDDLPEWEFTVREFSPGGYRVTAVRNGGVRSEGTGSDPDALLEDYKVWARKVDLDLAARQHD